MHADAGMHVGCSKGFYVDHAFGCTALDVASSVNNIESSPISENANTTDNGKILR